MPHQMKKIFTLIAAIVSFSVNSFSQTVNVPYQFYLDANNNCNYDCNNGDNRNNNKGYNDNNSTVEKQF